MAYTGVSIVDYLKSVGKPSDINSRIVLGKQYGIDYSKSTTNYANENTQLLNLLQGGTAPPSDVAPQVVAPPAPPAEPAPITRESDYGQVVLDAINKYIASITGQKPLSDIRTQYKESLGIPGMETTQAGLLGQVTDVEGLLDKLESDINARASAIGGVATEAQLRRRQAAEAKPLREQLTDLYRSQSTGQAGLTSAREELAAMMQLEEQARTEKKESALGLLPYYQEALKKPETPSAPTMKEWGGRMYQWDGTKWVDVGVAEVAKTTEPKKWTTDEIGSYVQKRINEKEGWATIEAELRNMGIPTYTGSTADKLLNKYFGGGTSGGGSSNEDIAG